MSKDQDGGIAMLRSKHPNNNWNRRGPIYQNKLGQLVAIHPCQVPPSIYRIYVEHVDNHSASSASKGMLFAECLALLRRRADKHEWILVDEWAGDPVEGEI